MYPDSYGTNPLYPKNGDFELILKDDTSGSGVICYREFNKGDVVAAFNGEIIHDIRQHSLQIEPGVHIHDVHFIGYFLHSCAPNVFLDMQERLVLATRKIRPGDYLMMDYAQTEDHLYKQFPCACGAANCRGWITGKQDVIDIRGLAYLKSRSAKPASIRPASTAKSARTAKSVRI